MSNELSYQPNNIPILQSPFEQLCEHDAEARSCGIHANWHASWGKSRANLLAMACKKEENAEIISYRRDKIFSIPFGQFKIMS